ncbi:LuxR C-terminal-related transcriptional regulator [Negadavirga shengliensis]|uniref:LuxR C-terminal-related transcriptional regulator n=1 Tax=Negadavirga shengliensis TaxID=1389218 RepID=A0ABV9SVH0_9BACT
MKESIQLMHQVWDKLVVDKRHPTNLPEIDFNEIVSAVFAAGPFYYYIIDFFDLSISHISEGFKEAHGVDPEDIHTVNDILALIHPEDMALVSKAEQAAFDHMTEHLGIQNVKSCKFSYNFRFKTARNDFELYNHQSLILTTDKNNNFVKSLNIHTNIHHLTQTNNNTYSIIGLNGLPSYLNLPIFEEEDDADALSTNSFSSREIEIIKLIADGMPTKQIADRLFIAPETVKSHRKNILRKAGCTNSNALVARGVSEGWI